MLEKDIYNNCLLIITKVYMFRMCFQFRKLSLILHSFKLSVVQICKENIINEENPKSYPLIYRFTQIHQVLTLGKTVINEL